MSNEKEIFVIGHKNPDTDSICSAIAYAYFKNQISKSNCYKAKRAGEVNSETQYVLDKFGVKAPEYVDNVRNQVKDSGLKEAERVSKDMSVKKAWELLSSKRESTLTVVNDNGRPGRTDDNRRYCQVHYGCVRWKSIGGCKDILQEYR